MTEAGDAHREFYPLEERVAGAGRRPWPPDGDLLDRLRDDLIAAVGAPLDDDAGAAARPGHRRVGRLIPALTPPGPG